jgi:hypothetical protein
MAVRLNDTSAEIRLHQSSSIAPIAVSGVYQERRKARSFTAGM